MMKVSNVVDLVSSWKRSLSKLRRGWSFVAVTQCWASGLPTLTGVDHQRTIPTNRGHF